MSALPSQPARSDNSGGHIPVLLDEMIEAMAPRDGGTYVDGTFGAGGYSRAILAAAKCQVIAIDRDPQAVAHGRDLAAKLDKDQAGRLTVIEGCFSDMEGLVRGSTPTPVDGIALDLGVSSMQLDQAGRGFSFRADGPLDMRMEGAASSAPSASDIVMTLSEGELADIIFRYGEERKSRRVARAIVAARREAPIERTLQLADIVRAVVKRSGEKGIDPATRTFQGLRIYCNDELGELARGLESAERLLAPGGRLVVTSFHSIEDRVVKDFLRDRTGSAGRGSRHLPVSLAPCELAGEGRSATFTALFRGVRAPSPAECETNPRARSAKLRAAVRTAAPAWPPRKSPKHSPQRGQDRNGGRGPGRGAGPGARGVQ